MNLTTDERVEMIELLGRYGRLIDMRDYTALAKVFTPEATFDLTAIGGPVMNGLAQIQNYMAHRARHPVAHHVTNIHVEALEEDCVRASCMLVAVQTDGSVASGRYSDELVRHDGALRIRRREFRWLLAPGAPPSAPPG